MIDYTNYRLFLMLYHVAVLISGLAAAWYFRNALGYKTRGMKINAVINCYNCSNIFGFIVWSYFIKEFVRINGEGLNFAITHLPWICLVFITSAGLPWFIYDTRKFLFVVMNIIALLILIVGSLLFLT